MMSLSVSLLPEPASCEMESCKSQKTSVTNENSPLWRARFLSDSSNAPATVQRTALRRVDPSTETKQRIMVNTIRGRGRLGTYTWIHGQGPTPTPRTLQRSTRFVRPSLDL